MRRAVQGFSLLVFLLLFALSPLAETLPLPPDLFLRADPLLGLTVALALRELPGTVLWGLPLLASALVFGRMFCGWLCPLGTCFDLCSPKKAHKASPLPARVKYYLLILLGAAAACTVNIAGIVDPMALLTRALAIVAYPLALLGAAVGLDVVRPAAEYLRLTVLAHAQVREPLFSLLPLTAIVTLALFALNYTYPRFWCRSLCPLGALLGLAGRFSLLKRRVSNKCTACMACSRACPNGAIQPDPLQHDARECLFCLGCKNICPAGAVAFSRGSASSPAADISRRGLLAAAAAGALAAFTVTRDASAKAAETRLIRPPGALPDPRFQAACIRCGACLRICPTNTLQPCLFEAGPAGIWSPRLNTRLAGCDQTCCLCGRVCPTGAIRELPLEEKKYAKIGTAAIDKNTCLVWAQDRLCLICDEQCPYNAIVFKWKDGVRRPVVIDTKCNGCGFCEQVCPVQGSSAIRVSPHGEIRLAEGSYRKKADDLQLQLSEEPGDDAFILETGPPDSDLPQELPEGIIR